MPTQTFTSSTTWTFPSNYKPGTLVVDAWGEGGNGANAPSVHNGGAGGGGGEYAHDVPDGSAGVTVLTITIGAGGTGTNTSVTGGTITVTAHVGGNASGSSTPGSGGTGSTNATHQNGGGGGNGATSGSNNSSGGGGGGSGGSTGAGGTGGNGINGAGPTGGAQGAAGTGSPAGAAGGEGGGTDNSGVAGAGSVPGGGGGGGFGANASVNPGAAGASGQVTLTWQTQILLVTTQETINAPALMPFGNVINQWANSYGQGTTFGSITSALQSCVVPLTPTYSVGSGSGTPTAGNWLFAIASWTQDPQIINVHVGVSDDIHSWWRQYPAGGSGGYNRTSISYTPNIARTAGNVYVAPDMEVAAISVLVIEVTGLGPWDTVTGTNVNYAAAATSLSLSLGAPASTSFFLGAVGGDNTSSGQAFLPAGWNALQTVSQTNGTNHLADNILTSAFLFTSSSQSVSGTASSSENMSGFFIGIQQNAASPIPVTQNPNWPLTKFEAAFGAGFNTPNSEITTGSNSNPVNWTDLSSRLWTFDETTGIQFQLGELQATNLTLELDNNDGYLSSLNVGSPYYSNALNSNMSFQSGVSPWTGFDGLALSQSAAQTYASELGAVANYSMLGTPNGTAFPGASSEQVAVSANWSYTASAWIYCAPGWASGFQVAITWYTSGHTSISTTSGTITAVPAATWTQYSVTGTSPSNAAYGQIVLQIQGSPANTVLFYFAEAALVPGSSAVLTGLVAPGVPIRLRMALGTIGGTAVNRWYVIQRNAGEWQEQIDDVRRRFVNVTGTDLWAALSSVPPTSYRTDVYEDSPYAWWPMDDQPQTSGVLPTSLLNAAVGNTNVLNITASPSGVTTQFQYDLTGTYTSGGIEGGIGGNIGIYAVGASGGWMYGDPQGTAPTLDTGNSVTSQPGSAAWQSSGLLGNTSTGHGFFLSCNDSNFPGLSGGITVEGWFNYAFHGTNQGDCISGVPSFFVDWQGQPNSIMTLLELATGSNPVAVLQLDTSGHLNLITYNGATGTSHAIYTTSDLRAETWFMVTMTLTTTTWNVQVNGGQTANVSGSATGMTSAWTWLILNGDLGANGGSAAGTGLVHQGNVQISHVAVYPYILPYYRIMDHYWAAVTAFGLLPAPTQITFATSSWGFAVGNGAPAKDTPVSYSIDGTEVGGSYGVSGTNLNVQSLAAVITANVGSYTSGPSAYAVTPLSGEFFQYSGNTPQYNGACVSISWTGVAASFQVYTNNQVTAETNAATVVANSDTFTSGFGGSASGHGPGQTASGTGAAYPVSGTVIGDTVGQRIERLLRAGTPTSPQRSIDPAPLLVQAPGNQGGGIQIGASVQEIQQSDNGLLFIDNNGNLTYWQRPHLASQYSSPVWQIGPTTPARIPYYRQAQWIADPQRIWNAITIAPFSPTGAQLPLIVPQNAAAVTASQIKYGAQPLQVISWLQSTAKMQNQANWLFANFGAPQRRADRVRIDAAAYPAAWNLVAGVNVGDIVQIEDWAAGGGADVYTYRVTEIRRIISYGAHGEDVIASVELTADWEPASYWS